MKIIKDFLFCNQKFTDTKETKPTCINVMAINNIRVTSNAALGGEEVVTVDMEDGSVILAEDPKTFFTEFADLLDED